MNALIKKTTNHDQRIANNSLKALKHISQKLNVTGGKGIKISFQENEEPIVIPENALKLLSFIIENMAEGKSISIFLSDAEVTTQQAADLLNVSRPYMVKLLEKGEIPFKKVGRHRRILLKDIISYEEKIADEREKQLAFLAQQAQKLNLGYQ